MKNKNLLLIIIIFLIVIGGSLFLMKKTLTPEKNNLLPDTHTSQHALDWAGVYSGLVPCADCAGILTTVTLSYDDNFIYQTEYMGKGEDSIFIETGSFVWQENGSIIELKSEDNNELPLIKVAENKLILLDTEGEEITGVLADKYVLTKFIETINQEEQEMYEQNKAVFPQTFSNYDRYVIDLPNKENENDFIVEILAGKIEKLDCNHHMISGVFETETVEGYGYDYYIFKSDGLIGGTQMFCLDDTLTEKFVSQSYKIRYNSKLPVVVFAPKDFTVKYNIWTAIEKELEVSAQ